MFQRGCVSDGDHIRGDEASWVRRGTRTASPEKNFHQLTGRRDGQPIQKLRQRFPTRVIGCFGNPRGPVDHAGFFHQASI